MVRGFLLLFLVMFVSSVSKSSSFILRQSTFKARRMSELANEGFQGYSQPETKQDALSRAQQFNAHFPCVILVSTVLDQNVGAVARTMLNFGLTELRLVTPACDFQSGAAKALASGASEILDQAKVYSSLKECVADLTSVFATSDRPRHMAQLIYTPEKAAAVALDKTAHNSGGRIGIMFGTERSGLSTEEVAVADALITIPSFHHFSSLNLAQAVNIVGYELWKEHNRQIETQPPEEWLQHPTYGERMARREELEVFCERLEKHLDAKEFQTDEVKKKACYRNIRNIYQRTKLTKNEVNMLHGIVSALSRPEGFIAGKQKADDCNSHHDNADINSDEHK